MEIRRTNYANIKFLHNIKYQQGLNFETQLKFTYNKDTEYAYH